MKNSTLDLIDKFVRLCRGIEHLLRGRFFTAEELDGSLESLNNSVFVQYLNLKMKMKDWLIEFDKVGENRAREQLKSLKEEIAKTFNRVAEFTNAYLRYAKSVPASADYLNEYIDYYEQVRRLIYNFNESLDLGLNNNDQTQEQVDFCYEDGELVEIEKQVETVEMYYCAETYDACNRIMIHSDGLRYRKTENKGDDVNAASRSNDEIVLVPTLSSLCAFVGVHIPLGLHRNFRLYVGDICKQVFFPPKEKTDAKQLSDAKDEESNAKKAAGRRCAFFKGREIDSTALKEALTKAVTNSLESMQTHPIRPTIKTVSGTVIVTCKR